MNIVRELRKQKGMQQKELALSVGVAQATVSEWEHGKKDPSGDRLKKLAEIFHVDELTILVNVAMKKCANPQECYIGQKSMLLCYCYIVQYSVVQWHKPHAQVGTR